MTRADEIADEFETPFPGRPELRRPSANGVDANGDNHNGHPSANGNAHSSANGNGHSSGNGHRSGHGSGAAISHGSATSGPPSPPDPHSEAEPTDKMVPSAHHDTLPEKARAAAGTWLRAAGWTAGTSLRVTNQLRKVATDPAAAQEIIDEMTKEVREVARDFLGITELDGQVQAMAPLLSSGLLKAGGSSPAALRAQGEALLRAAADVGFDESAHPAFARILTELSPDEARILRLLAIEGAQPMVDVRASHLIGNGSQLIAQALNMLGPKAGLRQRERVPVYLTNLVRLSLVALSDDALDSPVEYQVLEAQPEVLATLRDTVRAKTIRRSVLLTPLGLEFCQVCLPVNLPALPSPTRVD